LAGGKAIKQAKKLGFIAIVKFLWVTRAKEAKKKPKPTRK
jgi:hypothetical protein